MWIQRQLNLKTDIVEFQRQKIVIGIAQIGKITHILTSPVGSWKILARKMLVYALKLLTIGSNLM